MSRFIEINYAVINSDDISSAVRLGGFFNGIEFEGIKIKFKDGNEIYVRANKKDIDLFFNELNSPKTNCQPAIDWKPVEELPLKPLSIMLTFMHFFKSVNQAY